MTLGDAIAVLLSEKKQKTVRLKKPSERPAKMVQDHSLEFGSKFKSFMNKWISKPKPSKKGWVKPRSDWLNPVKQNKYMGTSP